MRTITEIENDIEDVFLTMPTSFEEQRILNQELFELSKELEQIENPDGYKKNINHWERN